MDFSISDDEMKEAFLDRPLQPISQTITIDSNHVHYVYLATGKPNLAVFVHGSPGSWSAFIDYLKNDTLMEKYDVVSIDRPGFGQSDGGRPERSIGRQAFQMQEVISRFSHENKVLIGHSLGGPVVARVAMDYPDQVDGLVLVAPSIDPDLEKYEWYRTWIDTRLGGWVTPQDFWVSNEEILGLKAELIEMVPLWSEVKVPTIVIQGTEDSLVPKENAEFARQMIDEAQVDIRYLMGVNHFIPWSHPNEIIKALEDLSID